MITVKQNFLDETFIHNFIQNIIKESQEYKPIWKSNINWGENIVKGSSLVLAYEIKKEELNYIKSKFIELDNKFKDKEIVGPIYLNKYWEIDWGGLYIWKEDNKLNIEKPEFNKLIINKGNTKHGTTLLNYNIPEERLTLQIFFK